MSIPHASAPAPTEGGCAAFLEIVPGTCGAELHGGLLLVNARGEPVEFVYSRAEPPAGALWTPERAHGAACARLAHALFDACRRAPDVVVCSAALGSPEFCRTEIAPAVPFAYVEDTGAGAPEAWSWLNEPPGERMRAAALCEELLRRGFVVEPFERVRKALGEVYGSVAPPKAGDDEPE